MNFAENHNEQKTHLDLPHLDSTAKSWSQFLAADFHVRIS